MRIRFFDKAVNSIIKDKKKVAIVAGVAVALVAVVVWFDKKFKPVEEKSSISIDDLSEDEVEE